MSKAIVRVKITRRPRSDEIIGFRLEAAVPNEAGRVMRARKENGQTVGFYATSQPAPSFRRPYLIDQGSDNPWITQGEIDRFLTKLKWEGYDQFDLVGNYDGDPLADQFQVKI
jgi:hypothetical protein